MRKALLPMLFLLDLPATAPAHYNMLLLQSPSVERGKEVKLTYQWGHPFEHELFDAPPPESLVVFDPDGKKTDLLKNLKKTSVRLGKKEVTTYELLFTPEEPGDYVFLLRTPAIWMAAEGEYYQDTVKVVLHVQAQKGWDRSAELPLEITPLTRPYGLLPGTIFQARVQKHESANPCLVEIERYNSTPPKELPADEFITRTVKTDPNGVVTCDLPEAGWWCLTATREAGVKDRDGKMVPVRERTTFWVHVAEKRHS
jgi:cobalt/nickel transport protein